MKCNNCGKDITNDSKFCEYCGVKIEYSEKLAKNNSHKAELEQKQEKSLDRRIYKWKEKLIDLSKRNRLLSFKFPKFSTIRIIDEQPPEVYRALVQNLQTMEFLPVKVNDSEIPEEEKKSLKEQISGVKNKHVCLSGNFSHGQKGDVEKIITENGGIIDSGLKKSTDILIIGDYESQAYAHGTYETKVRKAMEYNSKGCNICILKEADFFANS